MARHKHTHERPDDRCSSCSSALRAACHVPHAAGAHDVAHRAVVCIAADAARLFGADPHRLQERVLLVCVRKVDGAQYGLVRLGSGAAGEPAQIARAGPLVFDDKLRERMMMVRVPDGLLVGVLETLAQHRLQLRRLAARSAWLGELGISTGRHLATRQREEMPRARLRHALAIGLRSESSCSCIGGGGRASWAGGGSQR